MNKLTDKEVHETLEPVLKKVLENLDLKEIIAFSDVNYEGEQVIRVYTVLGKEIDGKTYSKAISAANTALQTIGEDRFAHMSIGSPPPKYRFDTHSNS